MNKTEFRDKMLEIHLEDKAYKIILADAVKGLVRADPDIGRDISDKAYGAIYNTSWKRNMYPWWPLITVVISLIALFK